MIFASLSKPDGNWLGHWRFDALPRVGERLVLALDPYEVLGVEHWPDMDSMPDDATPGPRIKIFVKELPPEDAAPREAMSSRHAE